ncbi:MAG: hypothetical protein IJZ73_05140 [Clostridia bacterium]|nr:hypothetical protein [Clostridia bacterium]
MANIFNETLAVDNAVVQIETTNQQNESSPIKKKKSLGLLIPIMIVFTITTVICAIFSASAAYLSNELANASEEKFVIGTVAGICIIGLLCAGYAGYTATIILSVINIAKSTLGIKKKITPKWMLILSIIFIVLSIVLSILIVVFINNC